MPNEKDTRGRNQDRSQVAGGQDHELSYEKKKTGSEQEEIKDSIKKVGNKRSEVEKDLNKKK